MGGRDLSNLFIPSRGYTLTTGLRLSRFLPLLLLAVSYPSGVGVTGEADLPLAGGAMVQDLLGRGIAGVEIAVFAFGVRSSSPVAVLMTDQRGRFNLQDLNPGSYLLALNKPGYQIQFARADTRLLALLQIRLTRDVSTLGSARSTDPDSMDWVLRLPRSDVLKEERPAATMPSDLQLGEGREPPVAGSVPGGVVAELGAGRMPVSADVSQWYGSTLSGVAGNPGAPESTERTTALQVSGDILGRGNWEMRGVAQSRSLNSNGNDALAIGGEARDLGASRLRLAMHYDLSADDSVQVQARFDRRRHQAGNTPAKAKDLFDQAGADE